MLYGYDVDVHVTFNLSLTINFHFRKVARHFRLISIFGCMGHFICQEYSTRILLKVSWILVVLHYLYF